MLYLYLRVSHFDQNIAYWFSRRVQMKLNYNSRIKRVKINNLGLIEPMNYQFSTQER